MNRASRRFEAIVSRLDSLMIEAVRETDFKRKEYLLSYVVIRLHDQWNFRLRQIVNLSYGRSEGKMITILRNSWGSRKMDKSWEPDWHIPTNTIRAAKLLNVPDQTSIQNAVGSVVMIEQVRWTRNAITHNIPVAFEKFRRMALTNHRIIDVSPWEFPLELNPQTGNTIYEDWCSEMKNAIRYAL